VFAVAPQPPPGTGPTPNQDSPKAGEK
jgi:hypothetical protein